MKSSGSVDHGATSELFLLAKKSIAHHIIIHIKAKTSQLDAIDRLLFAYLKLIQAIRKEPRLNPDLGT